VPITPFLLHHQRRLLGIGNPPQLPGQADDPLDDDFLHHPDRFHIPPEALVQRTQLGRVFARQQRRLGMNAMLHGIQRSDLPALVGFRPG
jgi:hypothetical protein